MDKPDLNIETSEAFADAFYSGVQLVAEYMERCSHMIQGVFPSPGTPDRDAAMQGLWLRALAWMLSLKTLNHTRHFQAIAAGNRALLEIAVDLVLLHHDTTNGSGWKMRWWALSEKLKAAQSTVRFFEENGLALPGEYQVLDQFIKNEKTIIEHTRETLWKTRKHPKRWTGASDLSKDVKRADEVLAARFVGDLSQSFTQYYRTEYRRMNWQIHSGVAIATALPPEAYSVMAAMSLKWCADLALLSTKVVLTAFRFGDALTDLNAQWDSLKQAFLQAYAEKMGPHQVGQKSAGV